MLSVFPLYWMATHVMVEEPSLEWFPQQYAHEFYAVKGILALMGTLLLIYHMVKTWDWITNWGQRLRYLTLLGFATLVTAASAEQMQQDAVVNWRNLGAMVAALALIVAMVVSITHDIEREHHPPKHL